MSSNDALKYYLALFGTVILWGSSFPAIKFLMYNIGEYTYTWTRGLLSLIFMSPYIAWYTYKNRLPKSCIRGGLYVGIFYTIGLWLQAWGTKYTTASNSAFITGLNVLFVHLFVALYYKKYNKYLLLGLVTGLSGLYLISNPGSPTGFGDFLVLLGAFMWALQILSVNKYSSCNSFLLVFFMFIPTQAFILGDIFSLRPISMSLQQLLVLIYLALFCNIGAFSLQAYGQRKIPPEAAATIFLLEPVFASVFSFMLLNEVMKPNQIIGAILILISTYIAARYTNFS